MHTFFMPARPDGCTQKNLSTLKQINGQRLHLEHHHKFSNRPTLVFLHDSLGCVQLWRDFPQKLAEATHCNVLVYDRLGYGRSDPMPSAERPLDYLEQEAAQLQQLLEHLKIEGAILFGHSDGGSIALIAASRYPQRIRAVICEAAHIFVEEITLQGIYTAMEAYTHTSLPQRLQHYHGDKVESLFRAWTETWTRPEYRAWSIEHLLAGVTCPLLFIQGAADEYGSLEQVEKTLRLVSGRAEKYILPQLGHTPHKESPQLVLEKAAEFILALP